MNFFGFDPFMNDDGGMRHMLGHMHQMDRMMNEMMSPFGLGTGNMMMGRQYQNPMEWNRNPRQQMLQDHIGGENASLMPFGGGFLGGGGGLLGSVMQQMTNDPNSHMYSQSSTVVFDGSHGGQPKVYESTNTVRKAGDVKEVRKTSRNSNTGEDWMSIGHSIGDRSHVIEKNRDRTGQIREQQRYVNLDQARAQEFDSEFTTRARKNLGSRYSSNRNNGGGYSYLEYGDRKASPIITILEDDDIGDQPHSSKADRGGPVIEEITVEEEDENVAKSKRRKGRLGGLFRS